MTKKEFKIFLDFDGTITKNDVGEEIFRTFLDENIANKIVENLLADKISARECWESLCESTSGIDKSKFDEFIHSQEIEPTLRKTIAVPVKG